MWDSFQLLPGREQLATLNSIKAKEVVRDFRGGREAVGSAFVWMALEMEAQNRASIGEVTYATAENL